jgi:heme-degrading monooxygenase HmoA
MIIRIVHHVCKPGRAEEGRRYMDDRGTAVAGAPGFLYRHRAESVDRPNIITSFTAWRSQEDFEAFRKAHPSSHDFADPAFPFQEIMHEEYEVGSTTGRLP